MPTARRSGSLRHIFLSPHCDDAVLSCGGLVASLRNAGANVEIQTVFAGDEPKDCSPAARALHARWGLNDGHVVRMRRNEDRAAAAALGVPVAFWKFREGLYRTERDGSWSCSTVARLFSSRADDDLVRDLEAALRVVAPDVAGVRIYAPLGVGDHVDHLAVYACAERVSSQGWDVRFYEDVPYAIKAANRRTRFKGLALGTWTPVILPVPERAIIAKIQAISCYRSQLSTLLPPRKEVATAVVRYAREVARRAGHAHAERYWRRREHSAKGSRAKERGS